MPNGWTVRKPQIIKEVVRKTGLSNRDAQLAVDACLATVEEALQRGDEVTFPGFGKFSTQRRAARVGVNPRNPSVKVRIPEATVPKFSAGSSLKRAVRGG
jgi:DNA-binding protein HU-beta